MNYGGEPGHKGIMSCHGIKGKQKTLQCRGLPSLLPGHQHISCTPFLVFRCSVTGPAETGYHPSKQSTEPEAPDPFTDHHPATQCWVLSLRPKTPHQGKGVTLRPFCASYTSQLQRDRRWAGRAHYSQ